MTRVDNIADVFTKRCFRCHENKPGTEFYRHKARKDGLNDRCKSCSSADAKKRYAANPEPQKARSMARADANRDAARAKGREYYRRNADKLKAYQKTYRCNNLEKVRARDTAYYQANRDRLIKAFAEYAATHRESVREYKRKYVQRYPEMNRLKEERRRARKRNCAVTKVTREAFWQRVEVFGCKCAYCGSDWQHMDHVKPLAKGGPHMLANLRPACARCNIKKSDGNPFEWLRLAGRSAPLPLPG